MHAHIIEPTMVVMESGNLMATFGPTDLQCSSVRAVARILQLWAVPYFVIVLPFIFTRNNTPGYIKDFGKKLIRTNEYLFETYD